MRELQLLIFRRKGLEGSYQCIYLMGKSKEGIARLFSVVPGEMTRSNRQNKNFYLKMILKKKFVLRVISDRVCPGILWSLHPWGYSMHDWTQPLTTCPDWACLSRELDISTSMNPYLHFCLVSTLYLPSQLIPVSIKILLLPTKTLLMISFILFKKQFLYKHEINQSLKQCDGI